MSISADIDMASNHTCFQTRGPWQFLGALFEQGWHFLWKDHLLKGLTHVKPCLSMFKCYFTAILK